MRPTQWLLLVVQFYLYGVGWLLAILLIRNMRHLLWQYSLSSLCLASGMLAATGAVAYPPTAGLYRRQRAHLVAGLAAMA